MKRLLTAGLCLLLVSFTGWQPDFEKAKETAREKHQLILLNFSGSDWCGPCIRMRKEIFDSNVFLQMADTTLILVNADFPRNRKNQLPALTRKQNESLAEHYNPGGKFPYTVIIDASGRLIKAWDGLPKEDATAFTKQVKAICDAANH